MHFFQRFSDDLVIASTNNPDERSMKAIKVISFSMKYLKEKLMELLENHKVFVISTEIKWVITVPAIWKASARQLMRLAAYEVIVDHCNYCYKVFTLHCRLDCVKRATLMEL